MATAELTSTTPTSFDHDRQRAIVQRTMARQSFLTLATSSASHRPHVVGVLYAVVDGVLYMNVHDTSIKARNVRENPQVAICIPVRKVPFGPPYAIQFQGTAELVYASDPQIAGLVAGGRLKRILPKGALEDPHSCFIRVTPGRKVSTFGLGVPLLQIIREPLSGMRSVEL